MDARTFNKFREIIYEKSGITLGPGKEALVSARVGKRMRTLKMNDHKEYLNRVIQDSTGEEIVQLLDVISTNVTSFFREDAHFHFITEQLHKWLANGQRRFRFWSAASSTGEEPYSLAITLSEAFSGYTVDVKILATDISTRVLQKCREGCYGADKVKPVQKGLRERYFTRAQGEDGPLYTVKPILREMVVFQRLNLSTPPFPMKGPFDMVLCRNVMIYFDDTVRKNLLAEIHRLLKPGGNLIVGHAESLTGMLSKFHSVRPSVYVK